MNLEWGIGVLKSPAEGKDDGFGYGSTRHIAYEPIREQHPTFDCLSEHCDRKIFKIFSFNTLFPS
jgi:hypothetical protein